MAQFFNPRWIADKTVARVEMNPFPAGKCRNFTAHDPRIYFTDGSSIAFVTEETEGSEYGTAIVYSKARKP
jgi:hypothetical protein